MPRNADDTAALVAPDSARPEGPASEPAGASPARRSWRGPLEWLLGKATRAAELVR